MPILKIDLQEVFSGETIVLLMNGREIYRGTPRTRMQIGLAESRSFNLPQQQLTLKAEMPASDASASIDLDLSDDLYVGVHLSPEGRISLRSSSEDFKYA